MTLLEALGEGVLENVGDNLLANVRNVPGLTCDALLAIHGDDRAGRAEGTVPLWRAIEVSLAEDTRERERLLETLAHP